MQYAGQEPVDWQDGVFLWCVFGAVSAFDFVRRRGRAMLVSQLIGS
jgi:hypothetical protein